VETGLQEVLARVIPTLMRWWKGCRSALLNRDLRAVWARSRNPERSRGKPKQDGGGNSHLRTRLRPKFPL